MSCICVWNVEVPLCAESVIVPTALDSGVYKSVITDKFGQKYEREITVYSADFAIDLTDYPIGLITEYSLLLFELYDGCELQAIGNCDVEYKQLVLKFIPKDTPETEIELCCN